MEKILVWLTENLSPGIYFREEEAKAIIGSVEDPALLIDEKHTIRSYNEPLIELLNSSDEGSGGSKCFEVIHKGEEPIDNCPLEDSIEGDSVESEVISEPQLGDGYYLVKAYPLHMGKDSELYLHLVVEIPTECPDCGGELEKIAEDWPDDWFYCPQCTYTERVEERIPKRSDNVEELS
ncbi:hypothetical protein AKJ62_01480 [candidate division MSBL1 archaeon SCGC-AAA259D14]|uniref:PAS domain-containing protein n=2 Tax=candidate division MSBL1 TaxID=215777 RepID=A0A133U7K7_9EURY|nr:hypothetical protein AKJ62_01480 [candidate division MSBL1 archaeon SCGC-AAA259D14]KXA93722.1 hypothetical protein AKJ66_01240 [candidate division MSBL1 archaeon SCGC-AAA259E22]